MDPVISAAVALHGVKLSGNSRIKGKNSPRALMDLLAALPPGRRRVALALVGSEEAPTYPEVAAGLGIHLGTVHQHLRRIRLQHPVVYYAVMTERSRQLVERHDS